MHKVIKFKIFTIVLLINFAGLYAQDFNNDILRINRAYSQIKRISIKTKYSVYRNHQSNELISTENGFIKSDTSYQYNKIGPVETLSTPEIFIMANNTDKIIIINKPEPVKDNTPIDLSFDIEKMIKKGTKADFTKLSASVGQYSIELQEGEYERINIQYGLNDYLLYRLDLFYRKTQDFEDSPAKAGKPHLVIEYTEIDKHPRFSKETFSTNQFIQKIGKIYQPSLKYQGYEIIDQTIY